MDHTNSLLGKIIPSDLNGRAFDWPTRPANAGDVLTWASCACVSFLAVLAAVICFFSSVDTFSSADKHGVGAQDESSSSNPLHGLKVLRSVLNTFLKPLTMEILCLCIQLVCRLAACCLCVGNCADKKESFRRSTTGGSK